MQPRNTPMTGSWREHVDQLLDDGERVTHRVDLDAATIVVTNRRVLVFTPDLEGSNVHYADRPNVTRASVELNSTPRHLAWATFWIVLGVGIVLLALTTDVPALVDGAPDETGDPTGIVDAAIGTLQTLLTVFELSVLAVGAVLLIVATGCYVRYIRSRTRRLVLRIAGDEDLTLPVTDADIETGRTAVLEETIGPGPAPDDDAVTRVDDATTEPATDSEESG